MKGAHVSHSFGTDPPWKKEHPRLARWCQAAGDRLESSSSRKLRGTPANPGRDRSIRAIDLSGALRSPMRADDLETMLSSHRQSSEPDAHPDPTTDASLFSLASKAPTLCSLFNGAFTRSAASKQSSSDSPAPKASTTKDQQEGDLQ
jgi:hypothetical protein